jgi:hypothetical protein
MMSSTDGLREICNHHGFAAQRIGQLHAGSAAQDIVVGPTVELVFAVDGFGTSSPETWPGHRSG